MKLTEPKNPNYAATVIRVPAVNELANCDNVVGVPVFGYQAIVGKDVQVGDLMLWFPAETQLSDKYAAANNLYRHSDKNTDPGKAGYIEDSRRVKALKFRGHQSDSLLMPLTSLAAFGVKPGDLNVGDTFDEIRGEEICRKYLVKQPGEPRIDKNAKPKPSRVDAKFFPLHFDTDAYWRHTDAIPARTEVVLTQKLHGTSVRLANTIVNRKLTWRDRIAKYLGVTVQTTEYAHVYGSRRVTKDANNPDQAHYYDEDIWSEVGRRFDDLIPENFIVYGEIIGWTKDGAEIQKNYTYGLPKGAAELYVYRVAVVTAGGVQIDLPWDGVKTFCTERGMKHVPELWRGQHADFYAPDWLDVQLHDAHPQALDLHQSAKFVDEGVCIRAEGKAPYILKAKSPIFLVHESRMLDAEVVDMESLDAA